MHAKKTHRAEIIPTVVPQSLDDVVWAHERYAAFAPAIHVDVADGVFAPTQTWTPDSEEKLPHHHDVVYGAHLMVEQPLAVGVSFAHAGARRIVGHIEMFTHAEAARDCFSMWKKAGAEEVGLALLLETPHELLSPYIELCDFIVVMTIAKIGTQGIPFDERGVSRVREIHRAYPDVMLFVDGGVNQKNIRSLFRVGASRFCVGAALAQAENPQEAYMSLVAACE